MTTLDSRPISSLDLLQPSLLGNLLRTIAERNRFELMSVSEEFVNDEHEYANTTWNDVLVTHVLSARLRALCLVCRGWNQRVNLDAGTGPPSCCDNCHQTLLHTINEQIFVQNQCTSPASSSGGGSSLALTDDFDMGDERAVSEPHPKPVSRIVSLTDSHPVVTKLRQQFDVWVTADRVKHLKAYRSKLPVLIIEDGSPVSNALCSTFCQRMVEVSSASLPVVIGESSGDMMNANNSQGNSLCAPIHRVTTSDDALTGTYSWLKGFQKCGGLLHGFLVYGSDNMSYNAYVSGIEAGCTLESKLRTAWKGKHTQLFLANSKDGSAGGTSNPCKRLTDNFIYLYSHAMDDVDWARQRASGKVKVSANIPERVAKVQKNKK